MHARGSSTSILDVLENALDGDISRTAAAKLSQRQVDDLFEAVNAFYASWSPPASEQSEMRVHLGGWVAMTAKTGLARDLLNSALLYAHEVVIYDPVAAYFEPRRNSLRTLPPVIGQGITGEGASVNVEATAGYVRFRGDLAGHRSCLGDAFEQLAELAPLIRDGVAVPIPHLRLTLQRQEEIFTGLRKMLGDEEYRAAASEVIDRPAITQDEGPQVHIQVPPRNKKAAILQEFGDPAYYLARTLALASASGASYLPPSATEWRIYEQRLRSLGTRLAPKEREDLIVAPAIVNASLPFLQDLSAKDLLGARRDGESFEHWRRALRRATRHIQASPAEGTEFPAEARRVLEDELLETADQVRKETSRTASLSRHARSASIGMATGAVGVGVGTVALGAPLTGLATLATSGMLKWVWDSAFPAKLSGTKGVLANFFHDGRVVTRGPGDGGWPIRESLVLTPK